MTRLRSAACLAAAAMAAPLLAQPVSTDLGTLAVPGSTTAVIDGLAAGEVRWFRVVLPSISPASAFFDLRTTAGTSIDLEAGVYTATGALVANDDDEGPGSHPALSFGAACAPRLNTFAPLTAGEPFNGRDGGTLAAGTYYIAVGRFNVVFGASAFNVTSEGVVQAGPITLELTLGAPAVTPPAATDLGLLSAGGTLNTTTVLANNTAQWFSFTLDAPIAAPGNFLDISTDGPANVNAQIALYSADGSRIAGDLDEGPGPGSDFAALSFGAPCTPRANTSAFGLASGVAHNGRDGSVLPAGTYYLGLAGGGVSTYFGACFGTGATFTASGTVNISIAAGTPATPVPPALTADLGALSIGTPISAPVTLAAGATRWFAVTIPAIDSTTNYLDLRTHGATNIDTELAIFNSAGQLLANDDEDGAVNHAALSFGAACQSRAYPVGALTGPAELGNGRDGAALPAGTYYIAVSGFDSIFSQCFTNTTSHIRAGDLMLEIDSGAAQPLTLPTAVDLGDVGMGTPVVVPGTLETGGIHWYRFNVPAVAAPATYLDLSVDGPANLNTSFYLYNSAGARVATDDSDGVGPGGDFPALSFGGTCATRPNTSAFGLAAGALHNGRDGALAAGTYYLAFATTDSTSGATCPVVNPAGGVAGGFTLTIAGGATPAPVPPSTVALGEIALGTDLVTPVTFEPNTVSWFSFTLPVGVDASNYLDVVTRTAGLDTEIAVYNAVTGALVATDDQDGPASHAALTFGSGCRTRFNPGTVQTEAFGVDFNGRDGATLAAGTYLLAVARSDGTADATFAACAVVATNSAAAGAAEVAISFRPAATGTPAAVDLGTIGTSNQGLRVDDAALARGEVKWFTITVPTDVSNAAGLYLDINTFGSALAPSNDTEIALYTAAGVVVDADDDDSAGLLSQLSYGQTAPPRPANGDGMPASGQDGSLVAGTYYLAVSSFDIFFGSPGGCAFGAVAGGVSGPNHSGTFDVTINTNVPGGPASCNVADIVSIGGFPPADGELTVDDYTSFINAFAGDELLADIVSIGGFPPADGELTVDDYTSFINAFAEGCPG